MVLLTELSFKWYFVAKSCDSDMCDLLVDANTGVANKSAQPIVAIPVVIYAAFL